MLDLRNKKSWKAYVERLRNVKTKIDSKAPTVEIRNILHIEQLREDANTYKKRIADTIHMMETFTSIWRVSGAERTFPSRQELNLQNGYLNNMKRLSDIENMNRQIGTRLACVKGELDTGLRSIQLQRAREKNNKKKSKVFAYPHEIMQKYSQLLVPEPKLQRKFFRPLVFLEIEVKAVRSRGKLVIELYTEACPDVVLELVKAAVRRETKRVVAKHLFPELWLECELAIKDKSSKLFRPLEYDMRCIDHSSNLGILSFPREYLNGFKHGVLVFNISLKPLLTLNGKRVAFGRVVRGLKLLSTLGDYGNKNGKMIKEVTIRRFGLAK